MIDLSEAMTQSGIEHEVLFTEQVEEVKMKDAPNEKDGLIN